MTAENGCLVMDSGDDDDEGAQILRELNRWKRSLLGAQDVGDIGTPTGAGGGRANTASPVMGGVLKEVTVTANNGQQPANSATFIVSINQKLIGKLPNKQDGRPGPAAAGHDVDSIGLPQMLKPLPPVPAAKRPCSIANTTTNTITHACATNTNGEPSPIKSTHAIESAFNRNLNSSDNNTSTDLANSSHANQPITKLIKPLTLAKDEMLIEIKLDPIHQQAPTNQSSEPPWNLSSQETVRNCRLADPSEKRRERVLIDFTKDSDFERFIFEQPLAFERIEVELPPLKKPRTFADDGRRPQHLSLGRSSCSEQTSKRQSQLDQYTHNNYSPSTPTNDQQNSSPCDPRIVLSSSHHSSSVPPPRTPSPPPPPTPPYSDYDETEMLPDLTTVTNSSSLSDIHSNIDISSMPPPAPLPLDFMLSVAKDFFNFPPPCWIPPMGEFTLPLDSMSGTSNSEASPPQSFRSSSPSPSNHRAPLSGPPAKRFTKKSYLHGYPTYYERFLATVFSWNPEWAHRDKLSFSTETVHLPSQFAWLEHSIREQCPALDKSNLAFHSLQDFKASFIPYQLLLLFEQIHKSVIDRSDAYEYALDIRRQQDYFGMSDSHDKPFLSLMTLLVKPSDDDEHDPRPPFRKGDLILIRQSSNSIFSNMGIVQDLSVAKIRNNNTGGMQKAHEITLLAKKAVARTFKRDTLLMAKFLLNSRLFSEAKYVYNMTPKSLFVKNVVFDRSLTFREIINAISANCL